MTQTELKTALVCGTHDALVDNNQITIFWNEYLHTDEPNQFSIPTLVEENADKVRARYLAWIHDLGEAQIQGQSVLDHMQLRPGFSYWWMTSLSYKDSTVASSMIPDSIKMMVLEDLIDSLSVTHIKLVSKDRRLTDIFRKWCLNKNLKFECKLLDEQKCSFSIFIKIYQALPHFVKALLALFSYIIKRWPLRKAGINEILNSRAGLTFCNYFLNLDEKTLNGERFQTCYWTKLHNLFEQQGLNSNWLHKYIFHAHLPSSAHARKLISTLNQIFGSKTCHITMDSSLSWQVILQTLIDYLRVKIMGFKLKEKIKPFFRPQGSDIDMWPFFKEDWNRSMHGNLAVINCLVLNLTQSILNQIPHQKLGFYLQENQPWEMVFIHFWRQAGHGTLIGVPHSTVRYWDLRYFYDQRAYSLTNKNHLPLPDKVALNGPVAVRLYKDDGYPLEKITKVEALRYLYLDKFKNIKKTVTHARNKLRVLVLGGYSQYETRQQMKLLENAAYILSQKNAYRFICKPHPACFIDPHDYPYLDLDMTNKSLDILLNDCDVAYTSSTTSAAVDAWCAGVPVITALDQSTLNMSPLRGLEGVMYVADAQNLAGAFIGINKNFYGNVDAYFFIDKNLSQWKELIISQKYQDYSSRSDNI